MKKLPRGFTLIELMVTISIAAVILAIGIPSFNAFVQKNRVVALSSGFISSVNYARIESVKRGVSVSVCPSGNKNQTTCGGANDWNQGWIVFVDAAGSGKLSKQSDRLQIYQSFQDLGSLKTKEPRITFASTGYPIAGAQAGAGAEYLFSALGCTGEHGRLVILSNTGRLASDTAKCAK